MVGSAGLPSDQLPAFADPPVAEVIIAVEFAPIMVLDALTLIALHNSWQTEFPQVQIHPAIAPSMAPVVPFEIISGLPPVRLWSLSPDGDLLLQVQNDRLIMNWRRRAPAGDVYPHYVQLCDMWSVQWEKFISFLGARELGEPVVSVGEVSYVNVIDLPEEVAATEAVVLFGNVEHGWPAVSRQARTVSAVSTGAFNGHLSLQAEQSSVEDGQISLSVVTRLTGERDAAVQAVRPMLDAAHAVSVNAFAAVTSESMHRRWGMT